MSLKSDNQKPSKKSTPSKARARRNVIFELSPPAYLALQQDAANRGIDSINQRGREIILDFLNHQPVEDAAERISALEQEVAGLREDLKHLFKLIRRLAYATITVSHEHESEEVAAKQARKATEWVKEHMYRKEDRP